MTSTSTSGKRAVIYARISKDRTGAGVGAGKQTEDCRELAARLGLEVTSAHTDNDITAFKGGSRSKPRPGYDALLDDIRSGRADVVLAWHTDRLHRDMAELEGYVDACEGRGGIPTYTVKGGELHLDTASGRMVARILGAVARQEVEHMIERQKSAKERIRKAGGWGGGPRPFGLTRDGLPIGQGGEGRMRHVPAEAAAIRAAYATVLALDPKQGLNAVVREWNDAGLRTPQGSRGGGNLWVRHSVRNVLLRASNAGLIEHDGKITGKGNWEPIVDEDTWRAARGVLTDPARRSGPGPQPRHLLTGILICGVCEGRSFRVAPSRPGRPPNYECMTLLHTSAAALPAGMKRFHLGRETKRLDEYVESIIVKLLSQPDVVATLNARPDIDVDALNNRRTVLNGLLDGFAAEPGITPRQLATASAPLLAELREVEDQMSAALRGDRLPEFAGNDPVKVWAKLKTDGNIERMRAIAAMLIRVRLLPVGSGAPPGTRPGMRRPFNYDAVQILDLDGNVLG